MENTEIEIDFKVKINQKVIEIISWFGNNYEQEIGGFLVGKVTKEGLIVEDIIFPSQDVDSGMVEIEGKDLVKLRQEYGDICINIIGEWHSHNTMGTFWSSIDETLIEQYSKDKSVSIFIVTSKSEHLVRIEVNKPFKMSLNKVDYEIVAEENDKLTKELKELIKEKVREKPPINWNYTNTSKTQFNGEIKYYHKHNTIAVYGMGMYIKESVENELKQYKFTIEDEEESYNTCSVLFEFENKKEAKKFLKFIKGWLKERQEEEDDIMGGYTQKQSKYSNEEHEAYINGYGFGEGYGNNRGYMNN